VEEAEEQILRHGVVSVAETLRQAGFWGYGLGMGQQGVHHLQADMPRTWQESGPTKLVAELGVPGTLLFFFLIARFARTALEVLRRTAGSEDFYVSAGIMAILAANLTAGIVSAQIYGDPFVSILLGLLAGMLYAGAGWRAPPREAPCPS